MVGGDTVIRERPNFRCHCGKFVSNVRAFTDMDDNIKSVMGTCKVHGRLDVKNWSEYSYEDFFPPSEDD